MGKQVSNMSGEFERAGIRWYESSRVHSRRAVKMRKPQMRRELATSDAYSSRLTHMRRLWKYDIAAAAAAV